MAEVAWQVAEVHGPELDGNPRRFLDDRTEIAPAVTRQDDPVDVLGDLQVPGDPLRRHQGGHGDRQDGDLGREAGPRRQVVEHLPQREFRQAAGHEEVIEGGPS